MSYFLKCTSYSNTATSRNIAQPEHPLSSPFHQIPESHSGRFVPFFFLNSKELGKIPIRIQPMSEEICFVHSMTSSMCDTSRESPPVRGCVSVKWMWERNSTNFKQCFMWIWQNKTSECKMRVRFYVLKMGRHSQSKANPWARAQTDHLMATCYFFFFNRKAREKKKTTQPRWAFYLSAPTIAWSHNSNTTHILSHEIIMARLVRLPETKKEGN